MCGILENWSLRRGGCLREVVATGGSTVFCTRLVYISHESYNNNNNNNNNYYYYYYYYNFWINTNYFLMTSDNRKGCYPISWARGSSSNKLKLYHTCNKKVNLFFGFRNQLSSTIDLCDFLLTVNLADHSFWFKIQVILKTCYLKTFVRALLYILTSNC